jgi:predicted PurR-regulated permease PerM
MIDGRSLTAQLYHLLPDRFTDEVRLSLSTIDHTFGGFMRGTLLQAFIYGVAVTVLMLVFDLQFAVVVGVACGVLMLVPIVGGVIGLALPLLTGLLQSSPYTLLIVVLLFAFQLILFNLIMPRILSQSLRMPTLLVFVALIVGGQLLGIWGLLFAVPAVGALYSIGVALLHRAKYQTDPDAPHAHRHA